MSNTEETKVAQLLQEREEILKSLIKTKSEKNFYFFARQAFAVLNPSTTLYENWHIEYICTILQKEFERIERNEPATYGDIIINVPPRSLKSEICSIFFPVWCWIKNPAINLITTSHTLALSETLARKSMMLINSSFIKDNWGETLQLSKESVSEMVTTKNGTRRISSTDGKIIGYGADIIIIDDPQEPSTARSKLEREKTISYYREALSSRLNRPSVGVKILIMQRLHVEDLTGWLLENGNQKRILNIRLPAQYDKKVVNCPMLDTYAKNFSDKNKENALNPYDNEHNLLFPDYFTLDFLETQKFTQGAITYAGQFQQTPVAGEGNLFKPDEFVVISKEEFLHLFQKYNPPINFMVDTASSSKSRSDRSAYCAYTTIKNTTYILNITAERVPPEKIWERVVRFVKINGYSSRSIITIEPRSSGQTVIGTIRQNTSLNIRELRYHKKGISLNSGKEERANAIIPSIVGGRVVLVNGAWLEEFLLESAEFPYGKHDDRVDVFIMSVLDSIFNPFNLSNRSGIKRLN
jgi:predicted phage terminase large subunit-like protein